MQIDAALPPTLHLCAFAPLRESINGYVAHEHDSENGPRLPPSPGHGRAARINLARVRSTTHDHFVRR
jgi:hypothetical protein